FAYQLQVRRLDFFRRVAAVPRLAVLGLDLAAREVALQDEVHHPLRRRIAVALRDVLGEDLHLLDRLGRVGAQLAEAGDARAVDENHGEAPAASAAAAGLRPERRDQIRDRSRP